LVLKPEDTNSEEDSTEMIGDDLYITIGLFLSFWAATIISKHHFISEVLRVPRPPDVDVFEIQSVLGGGNDWMKRTAFFAVLLVFVAVMTLDQHLVFAIFGAALIVAMSFALYFAVHRVIKPIFLFQAERNLTELGSAAFEAEDYARDYVIRHVEYALKSMSVEQTSQTKAPR